MREIIFDTETTGLNANTDRIIELGGVELVNRFPTGRTFHAYINPDGRAIDPEAKAVHGITEAQLVDKPVFAGIVEEFLAFVDDARLVAHNASFDIAFINAEFQRVGHPPVEPHRVVDTLALARRKHPLGPNSLDALCRRYGVDNGHRTKHGALLDSELLAEVYIELAGGRQAALILETVAVQSQSEVPGASVEIMLPQRPEPLAARLSEDQLDAHARLVAKLGDKAIWREIENDAA